MEKARRPTDEAEPAIHSSEDRAFYECLSKPTNGPRYPVLTLVFELTERIRDDWGRVARRLTSGR